CRRRSLLPRRAGHRARKARRTAPDLRHRDRGRRAAVLKQTGRPLLPVGECAATSRHHNRAVVQLSFCSSPIFCPKRWAWANRTQQTRRRKTAAGLSFGVLFFLFFLFFLFLLLFGLLFGKFALALQAQLVQGLFVLFPLDAQHHLVLLHLVVEGAAGQSAGFGGLLDGHPLGLPLPVHLIKVIGQGQGVAAKMDAAGFGRRDALGLALPDVGPL